MNQDAQLETPPAEVSAAAESAPTRPAKSTAIVLLAVLALATAVAAGGAAYYVWREYKAGHQAMQFAQREIEQLRAQARERDTALERDLTKLHAQQKGQQDALDILNAHKDQTRAGSSRDWSLREIEYLLRIANLRLQLDHDVPSAVAALAAANERLRDLADPALLAVRRQLAVELSALRAVALPDREGLLLALISHSQRVDKLPLANEPPRAVTATPAATAKSATRDWRAAGDAAWQALQRLVVIRHADQPVQPLLAPEQEYFLRQNLRLQLEAARVALLREDATGFRASLHSAQDWLTQYFDSSDRAVSSLIEALAEMALQNISPTLPDISESLRLLQLQLAPEHIMEGDAIQHGPSRHVPNGGVRAS